MKIKELLQKIDEVHNKFGTSTPYVCGGVVRDKFMGRLDNILDLDITTGDSSVQYLGQEFLNDMRKTFSVQSKVGADGHLSIGFSNFKLDFSSNFVLPNIDTIVGKPLSPIERETYSRDFTCNSLISDINLKNVYDLTEKGIKDIKNKQIDTILDPAIVLTNSKNRPLRSIYLSIKLDFDISKRVVDYLSKYPFLIKESTTSSLKEKLSYCVSKDKDKTIYLLKKTNMISFLPPELING